MLLFQLLIPGGMISCGMIAPVLAIFTLTEVFLLLSKRISAFEMEHQEQEVCGQWDDPDRHGFSWFGWLEEPQVGVGARAAALFALAAAAADLAFFFW